MRNHEIRAVLHGAFEPSFAGVFDVEDVLRVLVELRVSNPLTVLFDRQRPVLAQGDAPRGAKKPVNQERLCVHWVKK